MADSVYTGQENTVYWLSGWQCIQWSRKYSVLFKWLTVYTLVKKIQCTGWVIDSVYTGQENTVYWLSGWQCIHWSRTCGFEFGPHSVLRPVWQINKSIYSILCRFVRQKVLTLRIGYKYKPDLLWWGLTQIIQGPISFSTLSIAVEKSPART